MGVDCLERILDHLPSETMILGLIPGVTLLEKVLLAEWAEALDDFALFVLPFMDA